MRDRLSVLRARKHETLAPGRDGYGLSQVELGNVRESGRPMGLCVEAVTARGRGVHVEGVHVPRDRDDKRNVDLVAEDSAHLAHVLCALTKLQRRDAPA